MIDKALHGTNRYWGWLAALVVIMAIGFFFYLQQLDMGLAITGMSRDVSWGFYIAQFTFLVGVAASAVVLVLPHYLHDYHTFARITILGEFLAVPAVLMCVLFVVADLGQPSRALNVMLYPTPNSIMFWDFIVLGGYLILNIVIGWVTLNSQREGVPPPAWIKPVIYLSIPWAISIHTVTAFLYAGLPARDLWLTAVMAPRFLTSAFASGPSLLIILALIVRATTRFDPGLPVLRKIAQIATYAMVANLFLLGMEFFTAFYSQIPGHMANLRFLYFGLDGHYQMVPWMWTSLILAIIAIVVLIVPRIQKSTRVLAGAAAAIFVAAWIDKGLGLIVGGFTPTPLEHVTAYSPTGPELLIALAVYAAGFFVLSVLYKIAVSVREEVDEPSEATA